MTCPECGAKNATGLPYCSVCGCSLKKINTSAPKPIDPHVPYDPYDPKQNPNAPTLGMKWFKFLIYFYLFATAVSGVINAILYLNDAASLYYKILPGLESLIKVYAVLLLILSAWLVFVRFALARYKRQAPTLLIISYLCIDLVSFVRIIGVLVVEHAADLLDPLYLVGSVLALILELILLAIFISLNVSYFRKRSYLFVN